jgi:hypothetical protein
VSVWKDLDRQAGVNFQELQQDPVPVQGKLRAHLITRGRQIAQDMDLGQVEPNDLAELGRLDAIAQHPELDPVLAMALDMIATNRDHNPYPS